MDGKHIVIKQPKNSGSYYFNYKGTFSVVLLALVDANYKFIYVDVGCNGRISDGGIYRNSSLSKAIENCLLGIPPDRIIAKGMGALPHVILIDDTCPLTINLVKPYPLRNLLLRYRVLRYYRLSRGRRIAENGFGILANRIRVFLSPIQLSPENVIKITLAGCALHYFLRENSPQR